MSSPDKSIERLYTAKLPLGSHRLKRDDLVRLYNIINDRLLEYRSEVMPQLGQLPEETAEQFKQRSDRVYNAFTTGVNVTGNGNEVVAASDGNLLTSTNMPDSIKIVYFTTTSSLNAVGIAENLQRSKIVLLLDFAKPIDLGANPSFGTPNASSLQISSFSEAWFTTAHARLTQFFDSRRTRHGWLHQPAIYDLLLVTLGLPFALWVIYKTSHFVERIDTGVFVRSGLYLYFFLAGLYLFRMLFSYSRWVFPKLEIVDSEGASLRHRLIWTAVVLGVLVNAIYDVIKALG